MTMLTKISGMAAVLLASAGANAAVLVSADFNAPTYADGALVPADATSTSTTAGQDGWLNSSGGGTNNIQVTGTATNGVASFVNTGQDVRKIAAASQGISSGSAYLTATFTLSAVQATGDYFIHMGDGGTSNFFARIYAKSATGGFVLADATSSGTPVYGTTVLSLNTTYTLLARYDFVAGAGNDTGALYINPTTADGSGDTPYVTQTQVGTDAAFISSFSIRQGTAANAPSGTVDNIHIDGANITTVPEPTSLALAGLIGLGALRRRRA